MRSWNSTTLEFEPCTTIVATLRTPFLRGYIRFRQWWILRTFGNWVHYTRFYDKISFLKWNLNGPRKLRNTVNHDAIALKMFVIVHVSLWLCTVEFRVLWEYDSIRTLNLTKIVCWVRPITQNFFRTYQNPFDDGTISNSAKYISELYIKYG